MLLKKNNISSDNCILIIFVLVVPLIVFKWAADYTLIKLNIAQFLILFMLGCLYVKIKQQSQRLKSDKKEQTLKYNFPNSLILFFSFLLIYFFFCCFSVFSSPCKFISLKQLFYIIGYSGLMWTALAGVRSRNIKKIIAVWLFSSVIAAGWGVYQAIVGKVVTSSFGNPNILAGYLVLIFPIVLSQLFYAGCSFQKHKKNNIGRFFLLSGALIIITAGLTAAKSRGAWLGISTAVLVLVFLTLINLTSNRKKILLGAGIILICLVCFFMFAGAALRNQISKDVRPLFWKGSLNMIKASPLTGHGLGAFFITYPPYRVKEYFVQPSKTDITRHAHCEYLEIAAETGLISLFFFVGMLILFFYSAARFIFQASRSYVSWTLTGLTAGLAGFLAHNIVSVNIRFPGCAVFFWFALGLSLGLITEQTGVFRNNRYWSKLSKSVRQTGLLFLIMVFMIITVYSIKTDIIAQVYFKKGLKAGSRGDWVKAIAAYQRSIIFDQSFIRPYYKMAYAYDQIGWTDEAVLTYKDILKQAPYYARTRANLGILYFKKNNFDKALICLKQAEDLNPYDIDVLISLSLIYAEQGQNREAVNCLERALRLEPKHKFAYHALKNLDKN